MEDKKSAIQEYTDRAEGKGEIPGIESIYNKKEQIYFKFLIDRLIAARDARESSHDEFNGQTYSYRYEDNQKASIGYIMPRKNKEEVNITTGTTREKKLAIMSAILNYIFIGEVHAYDENDQEEVELGQGLTDLVRKTERLEDWDEEAKILAYDELTSQGNVFVTDDYVVERKWDKKKVRLETLTEDTFKNFEPDKKVKELFRGCRRSIIPGIYVYLGNIKEYQVTRQPYIFTSEFVPREVAKAIYGDWPRWKYVPYKTTKISGAEDENVYGMDRTIVENMEDGWVEIIKYQDKWNDEYQIFLNGVMQLPAEFPMPWESGEYNLEKGNLEPLSPEFAYCGSIASKTKIDQAILDEMYRLAILKTQKSFLPPIANYSRNILTRDAFLPAQVHNDLVKGDIEVLGGDPRMYALQSSEIAMIELVKKFIEEKSITPMTQGQEPKGDPTATEVDYIQRQAKINLGLIMFGFMALHKKLTRLRLETAIEHWTQPIGTEVDELRGMVIAKYQQFTVESNIDGGKGERTIQFTEEFTPANKLADLEEGIERDEFGKLKTRKKPLKAKRIIQINPKALRSIRYRFFIEVVPEERETTESNTIRFENSLTKAFNLFGPEGMNLDGLKQKWALLNKVPFSQYFKAGMIGMPPVGMQPMQPGNELNKEIKPARPGVKELV